MKKILIVEDDPFIRDISTVKFGDHGYEVIVAKDGASAIEILEKEKVEIVLLDLDLPDMSGFDIVALIHANKELENTKILVFSNSDDEKAKEKAQQLGVSGFFIKATTDYEELFSKIDSL